MLGRWALGLMYMVSVMATVWLMMVQCSTVSYRVIDLTVVFECYV